MNNSAPGIKRMEALKLTGIRTTTTSGESPAPLWRDFMSRLKNIHWDVEAGLFSVQIYPDGYSTETPSMPFEKWAAAIIHSENVPPGMEELNIPGGEYAIFIHEGPAREFGRTAQFIFGEWLPRSGYRLAARPQFEIMPPGYRSDDPNAREEVWIPIEPII